eukprot:6825324-Ditylum_brightwellii.AAC.1
MAWSWAAHKAASVSPLRPAWCSHMCDWSISTPGTSFCWAKKLPCISLVRRSLWWALPTALGSVCLGREANFMRNFCVSVGLSRTIWVSASMLLRMYFAKVEHSQSWMVSTPVRPLPPRVQCKYRHGMLDFG